MCGWVGWVGEDSLEVFRHAVGLFACSQVCLNVWKNETAGRAIYLFFLVEAFSVTVGYVEAFWDEYIADFKIVQDAVHLPPTWPLVTRQTHVKIKCVRSHIFKHII